MLLFSGVFFTLGYVMGRNQLDAQVRASSTHGNDSLLPLKAEPSAKPNKSPVSTPGNSDPRNRCHHAAKFGVGILSRWRQEFLKQSFEAAARDIFFHATENDCHQREICFVVRRPSNGSSSRDSARLLLAASGRVAH